jgi:cytochrome c oxidase subunit 2
LPTNTHLRLLVSAADVLHSWTVPSFGLKVDACPGRLNQVNLFIKRIGVFFGQCSEICGVNHGFMPIVIVSLPTVQFHHYIMTKLELS